jgi:hypothetical protein
MAYDLQINQDTSLSVGEYGGKVVTGTTAVTGNFQAIQFIADGSFTSVSQTALAGDALTGVTFPAGFVVFAAVTSFQLATGKAIAYTRGN